MDKRSLFSEPIILYILLIYYYYYFDNNMKYMNELYNSRQL